MVFIVLLIFSFGMIANAASEEDSRYTIVLQSTTDEDKVISATADADEEKYDTFSAYFEDITADTYNVLVYYLNVEGGNNSLCTSTQWTCEAADGETDGVRVEYYVTTEEVDVMVVAIHNNISDEEKNASNENEQIETTSQNIQQDNTQANNENTDSSNYTIVIIAVVIIVAIIAYMCYRKKQN
jgi:hypothetical protein